MTKRTNLLFTAGISILYAILSVILVLVLLRSGTYPDGENTMFHLYRSDFLYQSMQRGDFFPKFDPALYNGVEPLRYFALLPVYFMALMQGIAGGNLFYGYLLTTGIVFFASAEIVFFISCRIGRKYIGSILGILWFFFPGSLYIWFRSGNLPAGIAVTVIIPLEVHMLYRFLETGKLRFWNGLCAFQFILGLTETGYALMTFVVIIVWIFVKMLLKETNHRAGKALLGTFLGFLAGGFWIIPAVYGSVDYFSGGEALTNSFQNLSVTLNPLARMSNDNGKFYWGISLFILCVFSLFLSKKKDAAGFAVGIITVLLSGTFCCQFMNSLFFSGLFRMKEMSVIASVFVLYSLLSWKEMRNWVSVITVVLLCIDLIPSSGMVFGNRSGLSANDRFCDESDYTFLSEARKITENRIALLDNSMLGSAGTYLVTEDDKKGVFGSGWEASSTRIETRYLNQALSEGHYTYLFDRALVYGADTIVIRMDQLAGKGDKEIEKLQNAAAQTGYEPAGYNQDYRLYHYETEGTYGTETKYSYLAIGSDSGEICMSFPAFEMADSDNLSDYNYEDLKDYKVVYLSGFTYEDRGSAEELVRRLSENGVRIIISADGIPEDPVLHAQNFLNLECQPITFRYGFPQMDTINGFLNPDLFPVAYENWDTVYINGLQDVWGTIESDTQPIPFIGTAENENIVVIGFRLSEFYARTKDEKIGNLLANAYHVSNSELPEHKIVPMTVTYEPGVIHIVSDGENVNTNIAAADNLSLEDDSMIRNNMIVVADGRTDVKVGWNSRQMTGIILSIAAIVLTALINIHIIKSTGTAVKSDKTQKEVIGGD